MFKVLTEGCEPKRATKYSAAVDLFAAEEKLKNGLETPNARFLSYVEKRMLARAFREILVRQRITIIGKRISK